MRDDDGDTLVDFDGGASIHGSAIAGADPQCLEKPWGREATACGLGFEPVLLLALLGLGRRR